MKCEICGKESHHIHHKDGNHKNNEKNNLQRLCTLCHSKIHGIEPKLSELKKRITYFNKVQKARLAIELSIKSFSRIELEVPKEVKKELDNLIKLENKYEKSINQFFKENPTDIYKWLISIKGIGNILAGKLLSEIDWNKTLKYSSLWKYAGFAPESKKIKGNKANWNHRLKSYCYQLVDCFIKHRTPKYRELYDKEKVKQIEKGIKKGHAHNRAIRKVAKIFLRDWFLQWEE